MPRPDHSPDRYRFKPAVSGDLPVGFLQIVTSEIELRSKRNFTRRQSSIRDKFFQTFGFHPIALTP